MRMRQRQVWPFERDIIIGKDVEIGGARSPMAVLGPNAAERALNLLRAREQVPRRQASFDRDAKINERCLVLVAPWGRTIVVRAGEQAHVPAITEQLDRLPK